MQIKDAAVKERPILMSAPMVRAVLSGRKTQTRRVMKPQPIYLPLSYDNPQGRWSWNPNRHHHNLWEKDENPNLGDWAAWRLSMCPYGEVGGRLWVRETHYLTPQLGNPYYKADNYCNDHDRIDPDFKWKPSIFMPRWASRLTLEITDIRVERVQDISLEDARREGIPQTAGEAEQLGLYNMTVSPGYEWDNRTSAENFARLWDSINEKRGFGWQQNPWCWCLSFKRVEEAEQ